MSTHANRIRALADRLDGFGVHRIETELRAIADEIDALQHVHEAHDEARMMDLEDALDQAVHTIEFMHGCLTDPEHYSYAYPEQTIARIRQFRELVPARPGCVHSVTNQDCPGCRARIERYERRAKLEQHS
jgi:hypothetical protein